jgi:hypothetical protein
MKGFAKYRDIFNKEIQRHNYRSMAEIIMWHAAKKGVGAGKAAMDPDDERVTYMVNVARARKIPFIAHVEFAGMEWDKDDYMDKFEAFLEANRDLPIGLIHMGQLDFKDVKRLLPLHKNLFFITSHANPINAKHSRISWTQMFDGEELDSEWTKLVIANKERFVLAFDNVFSFHWEEIFLPQVEIWRKALAKLPPDVAEAIAHGNAEHLWKLPAATLP